MKVDDPEVSLRTIIAAELARLSCRYAFYYRPHTGDPILLKNCEVFTAASIIKVPILFAWMYLERIGEVDRGEVCDLDAEPQVQGAGLSWLLRTRRLPFADVLLLMIVLSDNLCANLVIRRVGTERLNAIFRGPLGLRDTRLERKLMDLNARAAGCENWISVQDSIRLYRLRDELMPAERGWIEPMLRASMDTNLWLRNVTRDSVPFCHKTGCITGVLNDWGYTEKFDLFLLTQDVADEHQVNALLDRLGPLVFAEPGPPQAQS
jgi:beta-lactamase class A